MPRLFIFAIGGTGSRVLKSLTMLLAAGIKPNTQKSFEIVPIIIDPHKSNEDLKRTQRLLENYQSITEETGIENGFFSTRIITLDKLVSTEDRLSGSFTFNLQQIANTRFKDYIDYSNLNEANKALSGILFSGKSINKRHEMVDLLDIEMDIGFVGNPNIGSVVLNQFKDSEEFKEFASNYNEDDRVFIISSIFGGTGAAGFPTVLKNIRDAIKNDEINSKGFLQDAKIGAITVLPYFNVEKSKESPIQKSDFIAKTKAALYYYQDNVTGNNSINALYYIADDYTGKPYKNDPGDSGQKNDAHFIELVSALSVIDFLEMPDSKLRSSDGKAVDPVYKEFEIKNNSTDIIFSDLENFTERKLLLPLTQLMLFKKYLDEQLSSAMEKEAWCNDKPEISSTFTDDTFYKTYLSEFLDSFNEWTGEMARNKRSFSPFHTDSTIDTIIKGRKVNKRLFDKKVDYVFFNDRLSKNSHSVSYSSSAQKMIKLFFETTKEILTTKFGLKK